VKWVVVREDQRQTRQATEAVEERGHVVVLVPLGLNAVEESRRTFELKLPDDRQSWLDIILHPALSTDRKLHEVRQLTLLPVYLAGTDAQLG
jgi:hypothetical protein